MTKNSIEVTSRIQKISFIHSTHYKIGQKSNKKLTLLTLSCFLTDTVPINPILFYFGLSTSVTIILL